MQHDYSTHRDALVLCEAALPASHETEIQHKRMVGEGQQFHLIV